MLRNTITRMNLKKYPILAMLLLAAQICMAQTVTVSGVIEMEDGDPVEGVTVVAANTNGDTESTATDADGSYSFELPEGEDYAIAPYSNDNPWNGVSTFDFVLIGKHIEGSQLLDSPYKIIAADANNDEVVNSSDMWDIRLTILWLQTQFTNNTSWRFVDAAYQFPNPADPFQEDFPEQVNLLNLTDDIFTVNFVAVKIGDVNLSAFGSVNSGGSNLSIIQGDIFADDDGNCEFDAGETKLESWTVKAEGSNGTYLGYSNADGHYKILVPEGTYDISLSAPNQLWEICTPAYEDVTVVFPSLLTYDFGAEAVGDCEWMTVDLATSFLRRCFPGSYAVQYCNQGTVDATDVTIDIEFDDFFENFSSSIPWASQNGNAFTFDVGDVPAGECGSFTVFFEVSCDAVLGQSHCSSAHIYPDTSCIPTSPQWSGADLEVTGECDGDEIIFTLTNHGEDMTEPVNYVVIEDVMIQMSGGQTDVLLNGESQILPTPTPAANGATWRVMVNESANHPFDQLNTVAVEGCGTNGSGEFSLGFVTQFANGDEEHYLDIDCRENIGSWDPNDKQGFPLGTHDEHFIERGQDIEYLIRFQNTGTDTAFTVAIIDTLDKDLDWGSIRLGASSHPYDFQLSGGGEMRFVFNNIELPDSNVNEPASHGFVKFTISQNPDLDLGTEIENQAAIFFDFNDPVITNRTLHTIGEQYLQVAAQEVFIPGVELTVFPNPFDTDATFQFEGTDIRRGTLQLLDQQGRLVRQMDFEGSQFQFDGSDLRSGLYFFKIESEDAAVAAGKVLVN